MKKSEIATIIVVIGVIVLAFYLLNKPKNEVSAELAKCIGENSKIYVQLGCSACKKQEELFGDSYKYLNKIDCWYERERCINEDISATPTWEINGQRYIGVRSIEQLKNMTGC